jgi:hypothetical protein
VGFAEILQTSRGDAGSLRASTPMVMVTHTWPALFRELVAAVVAEALDVEAYDTIGKSWAAPGVAFLMRSELEAASTGDCPEEKDVAIEMRCWYAPRRLRLYDADLGWPKQACSNCLP